MKFRQERLDFAEENFFLKRTMASSGEVGLARPEGSHWT
jgi:hypothetical protein